MALPKKENRLKLKAKQLAYDCPAWTLAWLPDHHQDVIFTGGADGTIKRWNISATAKKYAGLFNDDDGDINMNGESKEDDDGMKLEMTNTGRKSIGISPITDIKCVRVRQLDTYLLSTVSVDSFVRVYALDTNKKNSVKQNNLNGADDDDDMTGFDLYRQFDMNERHKVYLCDQNGKKSPPRQLEQYGGCWSTDINNDCSVVATGDQFGQIYLWPLYEDDNDDTNKIPTVVKYNIHSARI